MGLTYFYAQIFGITFTSIGLAFFVNRRQTITIVHELLDDRALIFFVGIITTLLGSFFVLTNNLWNGGFLATVVTLVGWLILLRGILILLLPHGVIRKIFNAIKFEQSYYAIAIVVLVLGIYLAWSGFNVPVG